MASYLDATGVQALWERMKEYVYNCRSDVGYKCMNDEVVTDECFEKAVKSVVGSGETGYECNDTYTPIISSRTVTTSILPYDPPVDYSTGYDFYDGDITSERIRVTFDGVEYICDRRQGWTTIYGEMSNAQIGSPDTYSWSEYPFCLYDYGGWRIDTPTPGNHTIKVDLVNTSVETTYCFRKAVESLAGYDIAIMVESTNPLDVRTAKVLSGDVEKIREKLENDQIVRGVLAVRSLYGDYITHAYYNLEAITPFSSGGLSMNFVKPFSTSTYIEVGTITVSLNASTNVTDIYEQYCHVNASN